VHCERCLRQLRQGAAAKQRARHARGLCTNCGRLALAGYRMCAAHRAYQKTYNQATYFKRKGAKP
jgi:hypothetical protein